MRIILPIALAACLTSAALSAPTDDPPQFAAFKRVCLDTEAKPDAVQAVMAHKPDESNR